MSTVEREMRAERQDSAAIAAALFLVGLIIGAAWTSIPARSSVVRTETETTSPSHEELADRALHYVRSGGIDIHRLEEIHNLVRHSDDKTRDNFVQLLQEKGLSSEDIEVALGSKYVLYVKASK